MQLSAPATCIFSKLPGSANCATKPRDDLFQTRGENSHKISDNSNLNQFPKGGFSHNGGKLKASHQLLKTCMVSIHV